jgi:tRNA-specific 2-thiouridylase
MSGGIDSSFSAILLKDLGFEPVGVYLILHNKRDEDYHRANIKRGQDVSKYLGIKHHILDLTKDFNKHVYEPFIQSYIDGFTPNPCALCNRFIKFGAMMDFANKSSIEKLSTGHYVRTDGEFLYEARDKTKDQTYFLFNINREILPNVIFPLSNYLKSEVRSDAMRFDVIRDLAEQKQESNDICFVDGSYTDILQERINPNIDGEVIKDGEVVGEHKGYMHYTIGKRRGFTVKGALEPHYVKEIIPESNRIIVSSKEDIKVDRVVAKNLNMFTNDLSFDASVKVRYRTQKVPCRVTIDNNQAIIELKESVYGVAKGQGAVFYDGDRLLGGGWIC